MPGAIVKKIFVAIWLQLTLMHGGRHPQLGPIATSSVQGETIALVDPITPKAKITLQIRNNRIISLLLYQGYTIIQTQKIEYNKQ